MSDNPFDVIVFAAASATIAAIVLLVAICGGHIWRLARRFWSGRRVQARPDALERLQDDARARLRSEWSTPRQDARGRHLHAVMSVTNRRPS